MKRIITAVLTVLIILSSFSCGREKKNPAPETEQYGSVLFEGQALESYTVVITRKAYKDHAEEIVKALSVHSGYKAEIKLISDLTGKESNIILIGAKGLDKSHYNDLGLYGFRFDLTSGGGKTVISIDMVNASAADYAAEVFIDSVTAEKDGDITRLTLANRGKIGYSLEEKMPKWTLKEEKTTLLAEGLTYIYQHFTDERHLPYRAHVLKIDPSKFYLYMGTSSDGCDYALPEEERQTVLDHINSVIPKGIVPIAGVNADFFDISGDCHPLGLAIKEGTLISKVRSRPWCGYTYDGRFVCGGADLYETYKDSLRTAVGASSVLVKDGMLIAEGTSGPHPRTLAGVSEDGTIIIAVIDGRQPFLSNGAVFARCGMLMLSHGAYNAVNLDGGGSSCMILSNGEGYDTVNSPSDGELRRVYNSLLVVPK